MNSGGLAQPKNGGSHHTSTFLFKLLISVLSVVVAAGVLSMFDMSHTLVRVDEHLKNVDNRLEKIEKYQERQIQNFITNERIRGLNGG